MKVETVSLKIPGIKRSYTFYHISDGHVMLLNPDESESERQWAENHLANWYGGNGHPAEAMAEVVDYIKEAGGDGLMIAGDCVDYISDLNVAAVKEQLARLDMDVLYVYGNHEGASYTRTIPDTKVYYPCYEDIMFGNPSYWVKDYGEFLVVGLDNSEKKITEKQMDFMKAQIARNLPIILLIHVPFFTDAIEAPVQKHWGEQGYVYFTFGNEESDESAKEFCRLVKDPESHVAAIFAGHVHFAHAGEFAPGRMQYTSAPSFSRYIRKVVVDPA